MGFFMDGVTLVKNRFHKEQWQQLILECQGNTLTVKDWCAQVGVTYHAYYYWLHKLLLEACSSLPVPVVEPEKTVNLKKLEVQSPVPNTQATVIIHLPFATIEVQNGVNQQSVEVMPLALKNIC